MKTVTYLLLLSLCFIPACQKVRDLAGKLEKETEALAVSHSGPLVTDIPEGAYDTFTQQPGKVVIVDFHADWCPPCRKLGPILDQIANEHGGTVLVGKVNVDKFNELASQNRVSSIPDVRIYRDGKKVDQFVGLPPVSNLRQRIATQVKGLPKPVKADAPAKPATPKTPQAGPEDNDGLPPGMQRR